jgi:hypothetical protein
MSLFQNRGMNQNDGNPANFKSEPLPPSGNLITCSKRNNILWPKKFSKCPLKRQRWNCPTPKPSAQMAGRPQPGFQDRPVHHGLLAGHAELQTRLLALVLRAGPRLLRSHRQARRQDGHAHRGLGEGRRQMFVIPPVGKFLPVYEPNKHLVCIAGGSGVTPFRGFVREATRRKLDTKITVLYSVRTPGGHHFQQRISANWKRKIRISNSTSPARARMPEHNWTAATGRITPEWVKEIARQ